ncbi:MAG: ABC transporter permease [Gemmatimonadota bacterium]|nr:ABC transporter permease [Gemmatimonadota bacterium]
MRARPFIAIMGNPWVSGATALALTGLVAAASLWLGGFDPLAAFASLVRGSLGSPGAFLSITLVRAVPLILTGLAVGVAFRAGVWNIGAEGQLYAGAVAAVWAGLHFGTLPAALLVPLVLCASALGGVIWILVPAFLRIRMGVGEVITTILMNFLGIHLAAWMVRGPLQEPRGIFPQTESIPLSAQLPVLFPGTRLHLGFPLAMGLAVLAWGFYRWTVAGFRASAVGASEEVARVAGAMDVNRVLTGTFLASGALAGLAGGVEVAGVTFALYEGLSPGWGYTAIAVALLAGLHPLGIVGAGVLFGALEGGAGAMQRNAGIPSAWVSAVEAMVILSLLAVGVASRSRTAGPPTTANESGGIVAGTGGSDEDPGHA